MGFLKTVAMTSGFGASYLAVLDPMSTGRQMGKMDAASILGIVCCTCLILMGIVWRAKEREAREAREARERDMENARKAHDDHTERLYRVIEENTKTQQATADAYREASKIMVEVKDKVSECPRRGG